MGTKWLAKWGQQGTTSQSSFDKLLPHILAMMGCKAVHGGLLEVRCQLLKQQSKPSMGSSQHQVVTLNDVWLVSIPFAPETAYLVNRTDGLVLEADSGIADILEKRLAYKPKVTIQFQGQKVVKGDFSLFMASAKQHISGTHGSITSLGQILEIEYTPVADSEAAQPMISDFLEMLRSYVPHTPEGNPVAILEPMKLTILEKFSNLPPGYTNAHTAAQYMAMSVALVQHQQQVQLQQQQQQAQLQMQQHKQHQHQHSQATAMQQQRHPHQLVGQ